MTELDFESNAFLTLLTDALRSGPGSPPWHEAIRRLRDEGIEDADDYQLLVSARENLESGKGYRSVRAGPAFTQRLMSQIESETSAPTRQPTTTTTLALASAAAMIVVLLSIGYLLKSASDSPIDEPEGALLLVDTVASVDMNAGPSVQWRRIGAGGMRVASGNMYYTAGASATGDGSGLIWDRPINSSEPFAMQVTLHVRRPQDRLVAQVFVTDESQFNDENGTTAHELVWLLQGNQAQVILPNGRIESQSSVARDARGNITIRLTIDRDEAAVDLSRRRVWTGPHLLDGDKPRYVGVRFLRRQGNGGDDDLVFQNIRVNMRQQ